MKRQVGPSVDWARLLERARNERITPLFHCLFARDPSLCDPPVGFLGAIGRDYRENAGRFLLLTAGLREVLEVLRRAGIEAVVLKGLALAEPVYGDPALRPMDDIDLLVRRGDVQRACSALADLGYEVSPSFDDDLRRRAATVFISPRVRSARPMVDLHWDLVDDRYGPAASRWADEVWERVRDVKFGGNGIRVLSPTDSVIYGCVHLAVHHGLRGLLWYCDLTMMARAWQDEIEWERLVDWVTDARLTGIVYAALKCAEAMVGLSVPTCVFSRLRPRSLRGRGCARWLLPRFAALRSIPWQDYVVPPLLMDRGRDVAGLALKRFLPMAPTAFCGLGLRASRRF